MATITNITTGVQTVSVTGAVTPTAGLDISGVSKDATICVEVTSLTSGKTARIQLEDSVNGFTASNPLAVLNVGGQVDSRWSEKFSIRKYQLPNNNFGTNSAVLRTNVTVIDANTVLSFRAWIEQ